LRKATSANPSSGSTILRPQKGTGGNSFNLRTVMGLKDDKVLYQSLRVSNQFSTHSFFLIIHSAAPGALQIEQGLILQSLGVPNPKK